MATLSLEDREEDRVSQDLDKKERKKYQNRIAQRNYRVNQKRRIQALQAAVACAAEASRLPGPAMQEATHSQSQALIEPSRPCDPLWTKSTSPSSLSTLVGDSSTCLGDDNFLGDGPLLVDGRTPLHLAVHNGSETMTRILLDSGANVDAQGMSSKTALHLAAENGHDGIVELLLARSADPNKADMMGRTPLFPAVQLKNETIVGLLLASFIDVNAMDVMGNSALHVAVAGECETLAALLIKHGANINAQFLVSALEVAP